MVSPFSSPPYIYIIGKFSDLLWGILGEKGVKRGGLFAYFDEKITKIGIFDSKYQKK